MALQQIPPGADGLDLKASAADPTDRSRVPAIADRIFRPVRLAKFACLFGLAVFLPYLAQRLPRLSSRPEYQFAASMIQVIPAAEHPAPKDLVDQVFRQHDLSGKLSLLDADLCTHIAAAFARHPWVARVVSVKQTYPSGMTVELEYRQPVAMVQVKGGRMPIDGTGAILPTEDFSVADVARFPTIRLAGSDNMSRIGDRFTEPGLTGAARAAELLGPKWSRLQLDAIELPPRDSAIKPDDIALRLQARGGSLILWGRAPGTAHPGELTAPQKVARLEKYLAEFGSFDRPSGPYEIDIRHWQEITRRPAARSQASRKESRTRVR